MNTRLPSNLRPATCECVHLVMRDHFRSRDKDGGHTNRSAIRVGKYRDIFENIENITIFSIFSIYIKHLHIHC